MLTGIVNINGTSVELTSSQMEVLNVLNETRNGGCASVHGYRPDSNWIESPVQDIQFLSRVSVTRLYERRIGALTALTFNQLVDHISDDKLLMLPLGELMEVFEDRKQTEIASHQKTLDGYRDDGQRQGHDANYVTVSQGVKVHLVTEDTKVDGKTLKRPVIGSQGVPLARSIMIAALFLNVKTIQEGKRKPLPNSKMPVRMGREINSFLNKPGLHLKYLSLKPDNFDSLSIDRSVIVPDNLLSLAV